MLTRRPITYWFRSWKHTIQVLWCQSFIVLWMHSLVSACGRPQSFWLTYNLYSSADASPSSPSCSLTPHLLSLSGPFTCIFLRNHLSNYCWRISRSMNSECIVILYIQDCLMLLNIPSITIFWFLESSILYWKHMNYKVQESPWSNKGIGASCGIGNKGIHISLLPRQKRQHPWPCYWQLVFMRTFVGWLRVHSDCNTNKVCHLTRSPPPRSQRCRTNRKKRKEMARGLKASPRRPLLWSHESSFHWPSGTRSASPRATPSRPSRCEPSPSPPSTAWSPGRGLPSPLPWRCSPRRGCCRRRPLPLPPLSISSRLPARRIAGPTSAHKWPPPRRRCWGPPTPWRCSRCMTRSGRRSKRSCRRALRLRPLPWRSGFLGAGKKSMEGEDRNVQKKRRALRPSF